MRLRLLVVVVLFLCGPALLAQSSPPRRSPIIDMHLHALPVDFLSGEFAIPGMTRPSSDEENLRKTLAALERYHIIKAVASGPLEFVARWKEAAPEKLIGSPVFPHFAPPPDLKELRASITAGQIGALGELTAQYAGLTLSDPAFEPYLALAEELDIPVAVHSGLGPPGATYSCCPLFRAALGNPLLIEEALARHPKLGTGERVALLRANG